MQVSQKNTIRPDTPSSSRAASTRSNKPKLLDWLREALRSRHFSRRTEQAYCHWVKRYAHFHNVRHSAAMAELEMNSFLTHLAVKEKVSDSTQNQALAMDLSPGKPVEEHQDR